MSDKIEIKTNLERIIESHSLKSGKKSTNATKNEIDFDFESLYKELNKIIGEYKKETLNKSITSEKELSKSVLTF
ncbi:MAG: hypothetical protein BGO86_00280 [Chryseobacterium sp. 36-9]|nr:MAG: hypothetical protein BGO86_00280 [Chryseobacterium sp. 36-9]